MNIIVFIKQVPDTATRIKIGADGKSIDEADVTWIISPYDEYAIEEALKIKESKGTGKVTVVTLGSDRAATSLRNALAMGADEAIHLVDPAFEGSDAFATGRILAASVQNRPFDILFFGKMGVGLDQSQVPAIVAELLNLPLVSQIAKLEIAEGKAIANREIEGATEKVETTLPSVFAAEKGLNEPRYPSLKGIMAAKKKPLETINASALGLNPVEIGLQGSKVNLVSLALPPARQSGKILEGDAKETASQLVKLLHDEAKVI
jgi:electron transfer flavoprotein beta subunit